MRKHWSTPLDLAPQYAQGGTLLIHYGAPVISDRNTVVLTVKTGASSGFRLEGRSGATGTLVWSLNTDYVTPPHDSWFPSYSASLTPQGRVVAPAIGGRVLVRESADLAASATSFLAFYGAGTYAAAAGTYDATVFINTPIVSDAGGNLFFGFDVTGANPAGLTGGIARIAADGTGRWVSAAAAAGDSTITKAVMNSAPALSSNGATLYIAVNGPAISGQNQSGYLLALDSTTLATRTAKRLLDPATRLPARITDRGTSSPAVGSNGHVYFGVLENPFGSHNARGWMLHFDGNLGGSYAPGGFGWDITPTVVPASMVPGYTGASPDLLALKYNNYDGIGTGDGQNRLALLDPAGNATDPLSGIDQMNELMSVVGPTYEAGNTGPVYEWCINTMAADPVTRSIIANSEDGILYRWSLSNNTLSQSVRLGQPLGAAYTPTAVGPDGQVYAISNATLFAVGA